MLCFFLPAAPQSDLELLARAFSSGILRVARFFVAGSFCLLLFSFHPSVFFSFFFFFSLDRLLSLHSLHLDSDACIRATKKERELKAYEGKWERRKRFYSLSSVHNHRISFFFLHLFPGISSLDPAHRGPIQLLTPVDSVLARQGLCCTEKETQNELEEQENNQSQVFG